MEFETLRREVIIAIATDDFLWARLVLKGGNALRIVYGIGARASLDVDYSIAEDFADLEFVRLRLARALETHLGPALGLAVFDVTIEPRPKKPNADPRWGGYRAHFKVIDRAKFDLLAAEPEHLRRQADVIAPGQARKFTVEISKYEFCDAKETRRLGAYDVVVYRLPAIAAEKLRALCQQRPEYATTGRTARARDFYDLHAIATKGGVDLTTAENVALLRQIFTAKNVPLRLLATLGDDRDFHRVDWDAVRDAVSGAPVESFDFYVDFVLAMVAKLEALGVK